VRLPKNDIPVKIDSPAAVARLQTDFGEALGVIGVEYFSLGAGTDLAPLLHGLEDNLCQSPHWGYLISGHVVVTYDDGAEEHTVGGDVFHWPAGHSIRADEAAEIILFSPQHLHGPVIDHVAAQVAPV
jgi:hypothetical protein